MITILLADDHAVFLDSLYSFLEDADDIQIVAAASDGQEAVMQARYYLPDVALLDLSMPVMDGIEATRQICKYSSYIHVLILTISNELEYIQRAAEAGAVGFVLKETIGEDLLPAIRAASQRDLEFPVAPVARNPYYRQELERNAWDGYAGKNSIFRP